MITEAELIVERRRLKRSLLLWRVLAFLVLAVAVAGLAYYSGPFGKNQAWQDHIARIRITGFISGDQATLNLLKDIAESDRVKGLIIRIDSPGGSTAGSEALYEAIREAAKKRPVVAVMDTVAASGGYITAIAADHIVARGNTITGSIGVIFQFPEFSGLLASLGIKMEEIKSGDMKAEPSLYKPVSEKARAVSALMVQDSFTWFTGLVAERRKLPIEQVRVLADGRVYTGRQALKEKLIDELGGEEKAVAWLVAEKKIPDGLEVRDWKAKPASDSGFLGFSLDGLGLRLFGLEGLANGAELRRLDGLMSVWHPN
jgi:protease IV